MQDMDIKFLYISFLFLALGCYKKKELKMYSYCFVKQPICLKTPIDTTHQKRKGYDTEKEGKISVFENNFKQRHSIIMSNREFDIDYGAIRDYSYNVVIANEKLKFINDDKPIYFVNINTYNKRKYITLCYEVDKLGIFIESNFYSDSLNTLFESIYYNEFELKKIDLKRHYEILENTIVPPTKQTVGELNKIRKFNTSKN